MNTHAVIAVDRKHERRARDARRQRLGRGRYDTLVKDLSTVIRIAFEAGATASLWGLEGPLRAGLRADFCLQGWGWIAAELLTRDILQDAFRAAGEEQRPEWEEGQPEWVIHAGSLIERTRCANCHRPLPDGHFKFCSKLCSTVFGGRLSRLKGASEDLAVTLATRSI